MHNTKKSSSRFSLIKGVVLLSILVVIFLFANSLRHFGLPSEVSSIVNIDYDVSRQKITQISESQQDSLRKVFAGFWASEINGEDAVVRKFDNIEFRDNGIIWHVMKVFITFPSGDTLSMYHAQNAFLMPYGQHQGINGYACDVRIIRQVFIVGNDTCYGASQKDVLWLMEKTDDGIKINNRKFNSYTDELAVFFPEGVIDIVDELLLENCAPGADLQKSAVGAVRKQLESLAPMEFKGESVQQWIKHYYVPLNVDELLYSQMFFSIPESLTVAFGVSSDGKVQEPRIKSGVKGRVSDLLVQNISTWNFPRHVSSSKSPEIVYTFHLNDN